MCTLTAKVDFISIEFSSAVYFTCIANCELRMAQNDEVIISH